MPLILIFTPAVFFVIGYYNPNEWSASSVFCCCHKNYHPCIVNCVMDLIFLPIVISLGLLLGAIACAILLVPALIF